MAEPLQPAEDESATRRATALAIKAITSWQRHIGWLVYVGDDRVGHFIHLGWHLDLKIEAVRTDYRRLELNLDPLLLESFADYVFAVATRSGRRFPYGIAYDDEPYFDGSGNPVRDDVQTGLTCATFVMACFRGHHMRLLETLDWPRRSGDERWQCEVVAALARHPEFGVVRTEYQVAQIGKAVRFRPEEVAAAGQMFDGSVPVPFDAAAPAGQLLVIKL